MKYLFNSIHKAMKFFRDNRFIILPAIVSAILIYGIGCSNNTVTNPTNSGVTFQISQQPGTTGTQFLAKPSVDVKLTKVISALTAQNFYDTVTIANPNYVFSKDSSYVINEYVGVVSGQKWTFNFFGSSVSGGTAFTATSAYTVP
jgi:hypothetical protein